MFSCDPDLSTLHPAGGDDWNDIIYYPVDVDVMAMVSDDVFVFCIYCFPMFRYYALGALVFSTVDQSSTPLHGHHFPSNASPPLEDSLHFPFTLFNSC